MTIDNKIKESQCTSVDDEIELDSTKCNTGVDMDNEHVPSTAAEGGDKLEVEMEPQQDDERTETHEIQDGLPIDKGWAWVVLAGACFCFILLGGIKRNFGIFFLAIQDRFGSTASVTSLVATTRKLFNSFTSLIAMTVGLQFMSNRMAVMFGALVYTISNIISAFATDIRILFATLGCLEGIARAFVQPPLTVTLLEYFDKRRGLASGLALSAACLGGLVFAPIFAELFEKLGYSGTLLIVAGMTFTFLVTGALIRSPNSFKRKTPVNTETDRNTSDDDCSERESVNHSQENPPANSPENKTNDQKLSFLDKLKKPFDITLFKTLVFPIFLLMAAMLATSSDLLLVFLPPLSKDIGLTADQIGILMAIVGSGGLLSRILFAIYADREFMNLTTLLAVVSTIAGLTAHCARYFKSFYLLVIMAVLLGLTCEMYHCMYPVVLVKYLTLPKVKSCMGFTMLCHGVATAATYPVVGWLRDTTGNYYASYHFLGTMSFIGTLSAFSLSYVHKRNTQE